MPEYTYVRKRFCPSGANQGLEECVSVPENAIGVSLDTRGKPKSARDSEAWVSVEYLVPVEDS